MKKLLVFVIAITLSQVTFSQDSILSELCKRLTALEKKDSIREKNDKKLQGRVSVIRLSLDSLRNDLNTTNSTVNDNFDVLSKYTDTKTSIGLDSLKKAKDTLNKQITYIKQKKADASDVPSKLWVFASIAFAIIAIFISILVFLKKKSGQRDIDHPDLP